MHSNFIYLLALITVVNSFDNNDFFQFFNKFPADIYKNSSNLRSECSAALENLLKNIAKNDLNSLKMLDATAKLPAGILSGNVNQYGDFDECMEVPEAQYCLVEIDLETIWQTPYSKHKNLVHSYYAFKENFNDPAHRVPGFTMIRWGFCIPHQCTANDLKQSLMENFRVKSQIRPGMCQKSTKEKLVFTFAHYCTLLLFCCVLMAIFLASILNKFWKQKENNYCLKLLMSFSLQKNLKTMLTVKENNNEIPGVHGVRALSALALLMSHKSIALLFNPYTNRTSTILKLGRGWSIIGKNAIIYTDCFMLISGLLTANSLLTSLMKGQSMKFKEKLINRIFRITPNILALILFCTYILPYWSSGPLWPIVVDHHSNLCKKYMWRNLFYIHNYFGFENMCLTHTHQVGIDMQLFLITPIIIYTIWLSRNVGYLLIGFLALISSGLRLWATWHNELSSVVYFGISISKMFDMANLSYILPTHRATIYLIGVYLACLLKFSGPTTNLSNVQKIGLWSFSLISFFGSWFGPYQMAQQGYVYDKFQASMIATISPISWGFSVAFILYAINKRIAGIFGSFLCWKYFQICTKISYSLYLVQFPIFFFNVGRTRYAEEFRNFFFLEIIETVVIILAAVILTLFIEMPFQNIRKVILEDKMFKMTSKLKKKVQIKAQQRKSKTG